MSVPFPTAAVDETWVGRYQLLEPVGEGGMGVVHLARAPDGREVAVKVLRPQVVGDREGRERLALEVASLRKVRSPHVAEVLDADPWGPTPFVVTRYVPGVSLHELVRRHGPLPLPGLVLIASGLLGALRDVHAAGVLHRDVKPTNVLVDRQRPVLIDFGLARLAEDPRLTQTGWLLGTPGYLAPEVLAGHESTAASDVHGWAATLVYAGTGQPPYGRGHTMAVLDRTRRSDVDLGDVPPPLREVLAACLVGDPTMRPTLPELADRLARTAGRAPSSGPATAPRVAPAPLTRPYTVVARSAPEPSAPPWPVPLAPAGPMPLQPVPAMAPPGAAPAALAAPHAPAGTSPTLDAAGRFRRSLLVLGPLAALATAFALAPYLSVLALAVAVTCLRGFSLAGDAAGHRTAARGRRWWDPVLSVVGYPWHVAVGLPGTLALVVTAAAGAAVTAYGARLSSWTRPDALLAGGLLLAVCTWWGPGSRRVRHPIRVVATGWARRPLIGWLAAAAACAVVVTLVVAWATGEVSWWPARTGPQALLRHSQVP